MTQEGRGKLIAFRGDRLGGRLISLLNTMRMAHSLDVPYVVYWRVSDGLDDPRELFSDDFVRDRFIDRATFQSMRDQASPIVATMATHTRDGLLGFLDNGRHLVIDPVFGVTTYPFENPGEVVAAFQQQVADLPLNPLLAERLGEVGRILADGRQNFAYHIRRGDLTADRRAMNRAWPNKFVPDEFFEAHMRRNLDHDARVILFSDNASVLDRYTRMFPKLTTFGQLANTEGLTPTQRDALELFTMSLVDQIIAPPSSAFSSTAKTIGNVAFSDVESQLTEPERVDALDLLCHRLANEPQMFANAGEIGQYLVYAMNHLRATGRRGQFIDIARRYIEGGMNIAFLHADTFREMFQDGQYQQICDLRPAVERGYVHFQRSFSQVALYHGAALMMLGRKDEGLRELTSAFWHEPVEGEIDSLICALIAQGDLNRTNFWFADPVVERFFLNRFALDKLQEFFPEMLRQGVVTFARAVPTSRVMVWEWTDFTRWDLRKHYRYKGHFRHILTQLARHTFQPELKPHFDSFIGLIHLREGDTVKAEEMLRAAIAAKPDFGLFHKRLAELHLDRDEFEQAEAAIGRAIELEPDTAMYRAMQALIQLRAGDAAAAAATLAPVLGDGHLNFPSLNFLAADALRQAGDDAGALAALRRGVAMAPMNWRRQLDMGEMLIAAGLLDEAVARIDWTLTWADDHPPMVTTGAQLLVEAGQRDRALAVLDQAIAQYPDKKQFVRLRAQLAPEGSKRARDKPAKDASGKDREKPKAAKGASDDEKAAARTARRAEREAARAAKASPSGPDRAPSDSQPKKDKAARAADRPRPEKPRKDKPGQAKGGQDKPAKDKPAKDKPRKDKPARDPRATPPESPDRLRRAGKAAAAIRKNEVSE